MADLAGSIILIVERRISPFIVELQDALETCGAETMVARDVPRAVALLGRFEFDAVVLCVLTDPTPAALLDRILRLPHVFYGQDSSVADVVRAVTELRARTL
jgi:hypothetical protein